MSSEARRRDDLGAEAEAAPARPFNLTRWFLVLSFVSIVLISTVSAALLSTFLSSNMLHRDAVVTKEFVDSIVRAERAEALFRYLVQRSGVHRRRVSHQSRARRGVPR
jgi:hypothetical protein